MDALHRVDLSHKAAAECREISSGETKKMDLARAIALNPKSTKYYVPLGMLYENRGQLALAHSLYERGLTFAPDNQQLRERWEATVEQDASP